MSECKFCGDTGIVAYKAWPGGIEVDYEQPCPDCSCEHEWYSVGIDEPIECLKCGDIKPPESQ